MKSGHLALLTILAALATHCGDAITDGDHDNESSYEVIGVDIGRAHDETAPDDPEAFALDGPGLPPSSLELAAVVNGRYPSGLRWRSGFAVTPFGDLSQLRALGQWRGRAVDIATMFIGQGTWDEAKSIDDYCERALSINTLKVGGRMSQLVAAKVVPTITFPTLIARHGGEFARILRGEYDDCHTRIAQRLRAIVGNTLIYVRVGHEADRGYPWSIADNGGATATPDVYKRSFARVAATLRRALPGVRIVWNTLRNPTVNLSEFYPGDGVVDVLSMDPYDNARGQPDPDRRNYAVSASSVGWDDILGRYDRRSGRYSGIEGLVGFARARGKPIAFDEWAPTNLAERRNESRNLEVLRREGSNNDFYSAAMFRFFSENADLMEYETNFQAGSEHRFFPEGSAVNPRAGVAYRQAYRP